MAAGGLQATYYAAAAFGVLFHLSTLNVVFDFKIWLLLESYCTALIAIFLAQVTLLDFGLLSATARTLYIAISFSTGLFSNMLIYRLFFHRLRKFPGPFWAKISRFYPVYLAAKKQQYLFDLQGFHEKYGDIVRTGPRDLSICRASAVQAIYGMQSECTKSNWYGEPTDKRKSLQTTRDPEIHKRRRKTWDQAFSTKALASYQPRLKSKVDLLLAQLTQREGEPVNISNWAMFFAFDVMGDLGFGKDFHMLEKGEESDATKGIHNSMSAFGILNHVIWLLHWMLTIPGLGGAVARFRDWCETQVVEKQQKFDPEEAPTDIFSHLLQASTVLEPKTGHYTLASPVDMAEDSKLVIIAGSDTTSTALSSALYYLTLHPSTYARLQSALDTIFLEGDSTWSYEKVKAVPYLEAVIHETLRLKPPAPSGILRQTPLQGLWIEDLFVPGDVHVSVPTYTLHRDARYWPSPDEWKPERWLDADGKFDGSVGGEAFIPFSIGAYSCIGRVLAMMELRSVISRIALNFDVGFAEGETGRKFDTEVKDTFTFEVPDLWLVFKRRGAVGV